MTTSDADSKSAAPDEPRRRRPVAGFIALGVLALGVGAYMWMPRSDSGMPYGVIIIGTGACLTALVVYLREMSLGDVAETALDLLSGLVHAVGAVLSAIWSAILGLFGLD